MKRSSWWLRQKEMCYAALQHTKCVRPVLFIEFRGWLSCLFSFPQSDFFFVVLMCSSPSRGELWSARHGEIEWRCHCCCFVFGFTDSNPALWPVFCTKIFVTFRMGEQQSNKGHSNSALCNVKNMRQWSVWRQKRWIESGRD
jgi:hypothetical protein